MSRNVLNPTVSSIECLMLIRNDVREIKENQDHWLRLHSICAHVCMYLCIHVCVSVCMCIYVWMHLYMYMFISVCIYSVSMHV